MFVAALIGAAIAGVEVGLAALYGVLAFATNFLQLPSAGNVAFRPAVAIPLFFVGVFHLSEERTRDWLGAGFDADQELLELIHSGAVGYEVYRGPE